MKTGLFENNVVMISHDSQMILLPEVSSNTNPKWLVILFLNSPVVV